MRSGLLRGPPPTRSPKLAPDAAILAAQRSTTVTLGTIGRGMVAGCAWMAVLALQGGGPAYRPIEAKGPVAITPQAAYEVAPDLPAPIAQAPVAADARR